MSTTQSRTVVRHLEINNPIIRNQIDLLCVLYGQQLSRFLIALQTRELREMAMQNYNLRNRLVDALKDEEKYTKTIKQLCHTKRIAEATLLEALHQASHSTKPHLQARHWKLALEEAVNMVKTYWLTVSARAKERLKEYIKKLDEEQSHYVYWLLNGCHHQFFYLLDEHIPDPTENGLRTMGVVEKNIKGLTKFANQPRRMHSIALHVRKVIRKVCAKEVVYPSCKASTNRVDFDSSCWQLISNTGKNTIVSFMQYATDKRLPRAEITVKGHGELRGTLQLIKKSDDCYVLNVYQASRCAPERSVGATVGIDIGFTEVFAASDGKFYGEGFGEATSKITEQRKDKGVKRNQLFAYAKTLSKSKNAKDKKKSRNIHRHNLGRQKLNKQYHRDRAYLESMVNKALNDLLKNREEPISSLVIEDLSHRMKLNFSKNINRRLSNWLKGYLTKRIEFKCRQYGVKLIKVNSAYTSQLCPDCGYVDKHNRSGNSFKCRHCGYEGHADTVGATNILARYFDREIPQKISHKKVKEILASRFHRQLEFRCNGKTVPGRTLRWSQQMTNLLAPSFTCVLHLNDKHVKKTKSE